MVWSWFGKSALSSLFTLISIGSFYFLILSPFQSQLTILQNAINKWYTLCGNLSDLHAEALSQTGVSCSYVPYVIIAKYAPFQRQFYENKKKAYFFIVH